MNDVTLQALNASIAHWKVVKEDITEGTGSDSCALCALYNTSRDLFCGSGCPIKAKTGLNDCRKTPYAEFSFYKDELFRQEQNPVPDRKYKRLAQNMINFLISLLPEESTMMTEAEKQVEKLQGELDKLRKVVANQKKNKKWFPEDGDDYYSICVKPDGMGVFEGQRGASARESKAHQMIGGIFQTREEAEKEIKRLKLKAQIIQEIDDANRGWVASWEDEEQDKYFFEYYDYRENTLDRNRTPRLQPNQYPARSEEILTAIVDKYGSKKVAEALNII